MTASRHTLVYHIEEALRLAWSVPEKVSSDFSASEDAFTAIEAALNLCLFPNQLRDEPIRTIHHLSCTGGTLITKCIASMANVLILNEIDLHSAMPRASNRKPGFTPTDVIALLRQGDAKISSDLITKVFLSDLEIIREEQWKIGRAVVLRDHSHSQFLTGKSITDKPSLRQIVSDRFPVRAIVTVRNPIDSWLSMTKKGWHKQFWPSSFEEYCRRYAIFLDAHADLAIVKYEDFVTAPVKSMQQICELLDLKFYEGFEGVFSYFQFSGDSGRGGDQIVRHTRKDMTEQFTAELAAAPNYKSLKTRLGY